MLNRRFVLEGAALLVLSVACAFGANLVAGKERKLAVVQAYPSALEAPPRGPGASAPAPATPEPGTSRAAALATSAPGPQADPPAVTAAAAPAPRASAALPSPAAAEPPATAPRLSEAALLARFPPHHQPYREVTGEDVLVLQRAGALVLDARRTKLFEEGHIAGARPFSVWESDVKEKIEALVGEGRSGEAPVVVYCSGGDCEDSHMLAQQLFGAGFNNLLVYRDGWPDWVTRGGPRAAGARP